MIFKSIRFTLTLWYSVTLAVILILFSSFLYLTIRKQLYAETERELLTIAESVASPTLEPFRNSAPSVMDQVLEDFIGPRITGKFVQILDSNGKVYSRSKNLKDYTFPLTRSALQGARLGKISYETAKAPGLHPIRSITFPLFNEGRLTWIVQIGSSLESATDTLDKILLVFYISIPLSLLLLCYGGWFLAGRALKPVDLITRSAQKITAENLSHRLEVVNPKDEIGRLAETFNSTLARLENSFKRTRQFSADVSHELRTPLTILRGETEVGLKWAKEPEEFRELLQSSLDEIKRMSDIIEYLLDLSRLEEGELPLNLQELELQEFLHDLMQQTRLLAEKRGVSLSFAGTTPVFVRGDQLRLRQVFLNLLDNAVKYTQSGGKVELSLSSDSGYAKVAVADTGPGIPAEDLPCIFDRFYRVDKARNRAHGGTGLGLSLVKSLTEAHNGKIEVTSELSKGTVFTVYLPLSSMEIQ